MSDEALYGSQREVIDFLLDLLKKTAVQMLARQQALEVLCKGQDWKNLLIQLEHQLEPDGERIMASTREAIFSKQDAKAFENHPEWMESISRLVDDSKEPG